MTPAAKAQTTADFWHFAKTKPLFFGTAGKLYKSGFGSLTFPTNRVILCSSKAKALTDQSLSALFVFLPAVRTPRSERIEGSPSGACARHMGAGARVFSFFFFPFTRCTHAGQPPPIASGGGCSVSQKRHAPGGTHFCPHTRDRNSFPLVSPWGQNQFPCRCPDRTRMSSGRDFFDSLQPPPIASGGGCFAYKISRPACIFPAAVLQSL